MLPQAAPQRGLPYDDRVYPYDCRDRRSGPDSALRCRARGGRNRITAIGPTEAVLQAYPQAEVYDGRGKALFPGLINCHAHLTATLNRGITEDFGFPPNLHLPAPAQSMLSAEEVTVMALLGALESIKSGTTTLVENAPGIGVYAAALAQTGLRWVFAESGRDAVVPAGVAPRGGCL